MLKDKITAWISKEESIPVMLVPVIVFFLMVLQFYLLTPD